MTTQANPPRPRNGPVAASDRLTAEDEVRTLLFNRISWGAVLAGVMVALVTQLILNLIGIGIGAASFDPTSNANPSGSTFSIAAGIWWALSGILAALAGGYTAGRLSGKPTETSGPWHGLTAWAVTTLLVFYLLSTSVGAIVGGAFRTFGTVAGGAAQSLGSTAQTAAQMVAPTLAQSSDPFASIDQSIRSATGATDPAALRDAATAAVRAALTSDTAGREAARERAVQALAKAQNIRRRSGTHAGCRVRTAVPTDRRRGQAARNSGCGRDCHGSLTGSSVRRHRSDTRRNRGMVWRSHGCA